MTTPLSEAEFKAKDQEAAEKSFADFMAKPTIRLLVSTLPPMEAQETIRTLLQEAHTFGWGAGSVQMILFMLERLFNRKPFPRQ